MSSVILAKLVKADKEEETQEQTQEQTPESPGVANVKEVDDFEHYGQEIDVNEDPVEPDWKFKPLYGIDGKGKARVWQISFDSDSERLITSHGLIDGKKQVGDRQVFTNNSKRDIQQQALLEARQRYNKKTREGYKSQYPSETEDLPTELEWSQPMLANEYKPGGPGKRSNITKFPIVGEAKLDGIRSQVCVMPKTAFSPQPGQIKAEHISMRSRGQKNQVHTAQHWLKMRNEIAIFFSFLPPNCELDGELYSHDVTFSQRISVVRTEKRVHASMDIFKYHIFDIKESQQLPFDQRYNLLVRAYQAYLKAGYPSNHFCLLQAHLIERREQIKEFHDSFVQQGYEGIILRKIALPGMTEKELKETIYRPTRCNNLLKYKEFIDEEAIVIGVTEGSGNNEGLALLIVRDKRGNEFTIAPRGTHKKRREWFLNPDKLLGKEYTIRYQELTDDNVPRFPTGVEFRDYE